MGKSAEIMNPTIDQVKPGMIVRCYPLKTERGRSQRDWGIIIDEVNYGANQVLIADSIGGTKECRIWVPIAQVKVVWSIGTKEEAYALIQAFNYRTSQVAEEQEVVLRQAGL